MRLRPWRLLAPITALLLLAACSSSDSSSTSLTPPPGTALGGTIRVAIDRPGSVDPSNTYEPNGELIVRTMCDPLIQLDPKTAELKPGLAESWQVSDSGSKFVVRLRKGLRFSNGDKVTADDVVFTLTRIASQEFASQSADVLSLIRGFDVVRGSEESSNPDRVTKLEGVRVIDARSFEIKLRRDQTQNIQVAMADYVRVLASPLTTPVPRRLAERNSDAFSAAPVCSGPYRLESPWAPDQPLVRLVRSEQASPGVEGYTRGGAGYPDAIEFHVVGGLAAQRAAFTEGRVDVAGLGTEAIEPARAVIPNKVHLGPAPTIEYVGVTTNPQTPWGDRAVRVALSQAIDRTRLAREVHGGGRFPATGFLSPALGTDLFREGACGGTVPSAGSADAARATLSGAGIDLAGVQLPFAFNDELGNARVVEFIAQQWREAFGLVVIPQPLPSDSFLKIATSPAGFPGAFRVSWTPAYLGPDQYIGPVVGSQSIAEANFGHYSDVAFDRRLAREVRRSNEPDDLYVEYTRVEDELCESVPLIPVTFGAARQLIDTDRLGTAGSFLERGSGFVNLRDLYVKGTAP